MNEPQIATWREQDLLPIVETAQGRVRGLASDGIHAFKGLRYGAETAGPRRFMPPAPPPTWAGVRETPPATATAHRRNPQTGCACTPT